MCLPHGDLRPVAAIPKVPYTSDYDLKRLSKIPVAGLSVDQHLSSGPRFRKAVTELNMRKLVAIIAFAALFIGCSQPLSNREKGVLTGGALGSGLGAIIGNQVGSTGAGIAIGGAAGALAGGLIGNESDVQESRTAEQDERLRRQEQELRRQRREIEALRREQDKEAGY